LWLDLYSGVDQGRSADYACQYDPRFSYCTYVPTTYDKIKISGDYQRLLVVIHGSGRNNQSVRDRFIDFAEEHNCIILAPLFPCGITSPEDRDSYKYLRTNDIFYDKVLLAMIEEVRNRLSLPSGKFMLFGFSGGAHFAHRFFYFHPETISALFVASPGSVTLLDPSKSWWTGIGNIKELFNDDIHFATLRKPVIQLAVGAEDMDTKEITHKPGGIYWKPDANDAGTTRIDRLTSLYQNFRENGLNVHLDILPGVGHDGPAMCERAKLFFKEYLSSA